MATPAPNKESCASASATNASDVITRSVIVDQVLHGDSTRVAVPADIDIGRPERAVVTAHVASVSIRTQCNGVLISPPISLDVTDTEAFSHVWNRFVSDHRNPIIEVEIKIIDCRN